mgnify:CR=1 FL=1
MQAAITAAFAQLSAGNPAASFAVRSSATAEDMANASMAGQYETYLDIQGEGDLLAYFLAGDLPRAILSYRLGLRREPGDSELRRGLRQARGRVPRAPSSSASC